MEELADRRGADGADLHQARAAPLDARRPSAAALHRGAHAPSGQGRARSRSRRSSRSSPTSWACASRRRSRTSSRTPIAAASLGQVHRAALRDGREVVVKVQRPGIREEMSKDIDVLAEMAAFLDAHTEAGRKYEFAPLLEEFRKNLLRELDYRLEARNLVIFANNLREFDRIVVPQPVDDYTTSRVLTMDYITRQEDHRALAARQDRPRRLPARRAPLPRVPAADSHRRLLPRRPAPRQRLPHRRPPHRPHRPRHGRAHRAALAGAA